MCECRYRRPLASGHKSSASRTSISAKTAQFSESSPLLEPFIEFTSLPSEHILTVAENGDIMRWNVNRFNGELEAMRGQLETARANVSQKIGQIGEMTVAQKIGEVEIAVANVDSKIDSIINRLGPEGTFTESSTVKNQLDGKQVTGSYLTSEDLADYYTKNEIESNYINKTWARSMGEENPQWEYVAI